MSNPILDKNLEQISLYNPKLAQNIFDITALQNKIELQNTDLNEPNLFVNDISYHAQEGAENEALTILNKANLNNNSNTITIIFGFGLGYLFQIFTQKISGTIIIYEPCLDILRATLEIVDFSKELAMKNVYITSNFDELSRIYSANYNYRSKTKFVKLPSAKFIYGNDIIENFLKKIELQNGICLSEYNTIKSRSGFAIISMTQSLPFSVNEPMLDEYKNIYKDKTALIVSCGPTLDENIEAIKENRDKFVIFAISTAVKTLIDNGIIPDVVNAIEMFDSSNCLNNCDLSKTLMIFELSTHCEYQKIPAFQKALLPSNTAPWTKTWKNLTNRNVEKHTIRGTVSYSAMESAKILGCNKIILVGQDLAYIEGNCYNKNSIYKDLICRYNPKLDKYEITVDDIEKYAMTLYGGVSFDSLKMYTKIEEAKKRLKAINETLFYVKGINGKLIPTEGGYATFIEQFKKFAIENPQIECINTSLKGANIEGFENISLKEVAKKLNEFEKIDLIQKNADFKNSEELKNKLQVELDTIKSIIPSFTKGLELTKSISREIKRKHGITTSFGILFKDILSIYFEINQAVVNKSLLYKFLTMEADLDIKYLIAKKENMSSSDMLEMCKYLNTYFSDYTLAIINSEIYSLNEAITRL